MSCIEEIVRPRDWLGILVQLAGTGALIFLAVLTWGGHIENEISIQQATIAGIQARVTADESNNALSIASLQALSAKVSDVSSSLAGISAQLEDLKEGLRK